MSKSNNFTCIGCGAEIKPLYEEHFDKDKPWSGMFDGGVVDKITIGYGSELDGDVFIVAICDSCIKMKLFEGALIYLKKII